MEVKLPGANSGALPGQCPPPARGLAANPARWTPVGSQHSVGHGNMPHGNMPAVGQPGGLAESQALQKPGHRGWWVMPGAVTAH